MYYSVTFLLQGNSTENGYSCRKETFRIDGEWFWDHAIQSARWQYPATARFAGPRSTCDTHYLLPFVRPYSLYLSHCISRYILATTLQ